MCDLYEYARCCVHNGCRLKQVLVIKRLHLYLPVLILGALCTLPVTPVARYEVTEVVEM